MGTLDVTIFSDDFAADLRAEFRDLIGDGVSPSGAVDQLSIKYRNALDDDDDGPIFWLALAAVQWELGRLDKRTKSEALRIIESGADLKRWIDPATRSSRNKVLSALKVQLLSPPPAAKPVSRRILSNSDWLVGEIIAFRLSSGKWVLLRTIGHHMDLGGRSAICELLDMVAETIPANEVIATLPVRRGKAARNVSQFLFQEPRKKKDKERLVRLGIINLPEQKPGGYAIFVWNHVDRLMREMFDLE